MSADSKLSAINIRDAFIINELRINQTLQFQLFFLHKVAKTECLLASK